MQIKMCHDYSAFYHSCMAEPGKYHPVGSCVSHSHHAKQLMFCHEAGAFVVDELVKLCHAPRWVWQVSANWSDGIFLLYRISG